MSDRIIETRRFHARIPSGKDAQDFLSDLQSRTAMPLKARNDVRLAVDELFANVASYAYGAGGGYLDMTVHVDETARYASVSMVDEGKAFNPFADDDLTLVVGGLSMPELPFLRHVGPSSL